MLSHQPGLCSLGFSLGAQRPCGPRTTIFAGLLLQPSFPPHPGSCPTTCSALASAPSIAPKIASPCLRQKTDPASALRTHGSHAVRDPATGQNALHLFTVVFGPEVLSLLPYFHHPYFVTRPASLPQRFSPKTKSPGSLPGLGYTFLRRLVYHSVN